MANQSRFPEGAPSPAPHVTTSVNIATQSSFRVPLRTNPCGRITPAYEYTTPPSSPRVTQFSEAHSTTDSVLHGLDTPPYTPETSPKGKHWNEDSLISARHLRDDALDVDVLRFMPPLGETLKLGSVIGEGQWSAVRTAKLEGMTSISIRAERSKSRRLFAVKIGNGKLSKRIIQQEAKIFTHLVREPHNQKFVIGFYGYDTVHDGLVMDFVRPTLEDYTYVAAKQPWDPQLSRSIRSIAQRLVRGLHFLQVKGVIHGDIKPTNILLRSSTADVHNSETINPSAELDPHDEYEALYCDFSSSRLNSPDSGSNDSAQTYEYMAPELFTSKNLGMSPTFESDVYALGVTLTRTIIGQSPYASGQTRTVQRIMASQGIPLDFISNDQKAQARLEESQLEPFLATALVKDPSRRSSAVYWAQLAEDL